MLTLEMKTSLYDEDRGLQVPMTLEHDTPRGFVSVTPTSLDWKDRAGEFDIKLTQGVGTSLHAQYSWTVPSGAWTHRRPLFRGDPEELVRLFHRDRVRQERLEKAGHRSPKWEVLRSLQ
jgi:hypothetical protein